MSKENTKTPNTCGVRQGFYKRAAEAEKRNRRMLAVTAIGILVLASILLFSATLLETTAGKYIYVYGEQKQKIDKDQALISNTLNIDLKSLSSYVGITKEATGSSVTYKINGTTAIFENGKNTAVINGIKMSLPQKAVIKNGYCLIPIQTAQEIFLGVDFETKSKTTTVSLTGETVYMIAKNTAIEYVTDISAYIDDIRTSNEYTAILVNKQNPVDDDFVGKDLVEIPAKYRKSTSIDLNKTALNALVAMMEDMFALGYTDTFVTSAHRTYNYQEMLFSMYVDGEMEKGYSYDAAIERANKYSARPEFSEHRTGLSVDFTTHSIGGKVDDVFEGTAVCSWLQENAWKYGFVLRYPKDKVDITGYIHESWHYRFVGLEIASVMYQTGMCYEEYLEYFVKGE